MWAVVSAGYPTLPLQLIVSCTCVIVLVFLSKINNNNNNNNEVRPVNFSTHFPRLRIALWYTWRIKGSILLACLLTLAVVHEL